MDWRPSIQVVANPGQADPRTQSAPALASYNGLLYLVYRGASDNLFYISFDGHRWARSATKIVANPGQADPRTQSAPALASYNGLLYLVYRGASDNLFYISFDGHRWARSATKIVANPGQADPRTQSAPALASYNGLLHLVHRGDSNSLMDITFDGNRWARSETEIVDWDAPYGPQGPPALASHDDLLNMVHEEHDPNPNYTIIPSASILLQSAFNGHSWTAADAEIVIWELNFELLPALASYNDMLRMVYVDSDDDTLWYSYLDPNYTRPTYELVVSTPSASTDEHGVQTVSAEGVVASSGTDPVAENATLRLRREIESTDDETLAEVSRPGVNNANLNVEYRCPGAADSSGGTWTIYAEVLFGSLKKQSPSINVENCGGSGPPPPPPTSGYSQVAVYNCHSEQRSVSVWLHDITESTYHEQGMLASQWDSSSDICPPLGASPLLVPLQADHDYAIIAVDTMLDDCPGDQPDNPVCQRLITGQFRGKSDGPTLPVTVA